VSKISELTDGGSLLPTDFLIAVRSGGNVKVQADDITVDQIRLGDNEKIELGNNQDLQIYHDGIDSRIDEVGGNRLILRSSDDIRMDKYTGENMGVFNADGSVDLYYDAVKKFETTATGIDVTGSVTADGLTVDGSATIDSGGASPLMILILELHLHQRILL